MTTMLVVRRPQGPRVYAGKVVCLFAGGLVIELLVPDPTVGDSVEISDCDIVSRAVLAA